MNAPFATKRTRKLTIENLIRTSANFHEFFTAVSTSTHTKFQGDAFERLTQLYLLACPTFQAFGVRHVWLLSEVPPQVAARLNLPRHDLGIDIVVETATGEYWAVQCKFRSATDRALTMSELATFTALSFVHCAGFSRTIVAHTVQKPIENRRYMGTVSEIGFDSWYAVDDETWENIQKSARGESVTLVPYSPRRHQGPAITAAVGHFAVHRRGRMIMPCATGKSLTSYFVAEALKADSILVAVPSLALMKQSIAVFAREDVARGLVSDYLCVCSDETITESDDETQIDVADLGVPVLARVEEIAAELKKPGRKVVFTTYHSSHKLAAAARRSKTKFDLGILDEAHRTVVPISKDFATLLREDAIDIRNRLFMTATERVLKGKDDAVASMDNEAIYGHRFFQMTFKDAIDQKVISDYKIVTYTVSQEHYRKVIEDNKLIDLSSAKLKNYDAEQVAAGIALLHLYDHYGITHAISFSRSIRNAKALCDQQNLLNKAYGNGIASDHINGTYTAGQRSEIMRRFNEADRALLTNSRCLTEGVDVPAIDAVLFADPRKGVIDIVQAVGRALRLYEGKAYGYVLLPIIVPEGMTFDEFAATTEFKHIARVIAVLSTQDERIAEECRAIEEGCMRGNGDGPIIDIVGDVSVGMKLDLEDFRDAIQARIWEKVAKVNWRKFEEAREFVRDLGLKSDDDWRAYAKSGNKPNDIPYDAAFVYKDQGWAGLGDWLGTGNVASYNRVYQPFGEARDFIRGLGLKNYKEWVTYAQSDNKPDDIPANPQTVYKSKGWAGLGDWLGTGNVFNAKREYRPFEEARDFVRDLGFKSLKGWQAYAKTANRPTDIPSNPDAVYEDSGWAGWGDFLGTGNVHGRDRQYREFKEAREFVHGLDLKNQDEWNAYTKSGDKPDDIPARPNETYKDKGWISLGDWLGTGRVANVNRKFREFKEAREFVHSLGLKNKDDWYTFVANGNKPNYIPTNPNNVYKDSGWAGWGDWLGTGFVANAKRVYRDFEEAREFVRGLGLKDREEWYTYVASGNKPNDIPSNCQTVYKDSGWTGWGDWVGSNLKKGQSK